MDSHYAEKQVVTTSPRLALQDKPRHSDLQVGPVPFSNLPEVAPSPPQHNINHNWNGGGHGGFIGARGIYVSRQKFLLGLALVILIVIAAVVGTAVGVLKHKESSHTTSSPESSSSKNGSAESSSANLLYNQSSLAVTGWKYDDETQYSVRLFWQDRTGFLRISAMESLAEEAWTEGTKFAVAKMGTPLAASCHNQSIYEPNKTAMETHVYYLDEGSNLREFIFEGNDKVGREGDLNAKNITPSMDTRLASYWPSLVYQNPDKTISEVRYNCTKSGENCWKEENLQISGSGPSTALAEVPMGRNLTGRYLYYQRADEELVDMAWNNKTGEWRPKDFAERIPTTYPAAVLATPRTSDGPALNFVVLYQASSFDKDISYTWKNVQGWNSPMKDSALSGAMQGTSIACLTPESWWNKRLVMGSELSRCFFIGSLGRLREARWAGQNWEDLGFVSSITGD